MQHNFQPCLAFVLEHEGGYSDDSRDPGGATNLGVTLRTWQAWEGRPVTPQDIAALTLTDVAPLYQARYWDAVKGDELPAGLDLCLFDSAVNQGSGAAVRMLQGLLHLPQDGIMGPQTVAGVAGKSLIAHFCAVREARYRANHGFPTFGKGWLARLAACQKLASGMASAASGASV